MESLRNSIAGGRWRVGLGARHCDSCKKVSASVFCLVDSAFFCLTCDAKIHNGKVLSRHQRVWMCEVCEQAPAAVSCRADAAALCVSCDVDIHSANPLAGRHERVPVEPFFDSAANSIVKSSVLQFINDDDVAAEGIGDGSWVLQGVENNPAACTSGDHHHHLFILDEMNTFLTDLDHHHNKPNSIAKNHDASIDGLPNCAGADSHVVPVQASELDPLNNNKNINNDTGNSFNLQFCSPKLSSFTTTYPTQSFTHSVSSSSHEFGVVPDGNSVSDTSYPFAQVTSASGSSNPNLLISGTQMYATKSSDRKAKVLRFREKRKNRKFEKTIRYASRKAYAETRPRVKGRFAKRTLNNLMESDQLAFQTLSSGVNSSFIMGDEQYGVVPSF